MFYVMFYVHNRTSTSSSSPPRPEQLLLPTSKRLPPTPLLQQCTIHLTFVIPSVSTNPKPQWSHLACSACLIRTPGHPNDNACFQHFHHPLCSRRSGLLLLPQPLWCSVWGFLFTLTNSKQGQWLLDLHINFLKWGFPTLASGWKTNGCLEPQLKCEGMCEGISFLTFPHSIPSLRPSFSFLFLHTFRQLKRKKRLLTRGPTYQSCTRRTTYIF